MGRVVNFCIEQIQFLAKQNHISDRSIILQASKLIHSKSIIQPCRYSDQAISTDEVNCGEAINRRGRQGDSGAFEKSAEVKALRGND